MYAQNGSIPLRHLPGRALVFTRGIRVRVLEGVGTREYFVEGEPLDSRVRGLVLETRI